MRNEKIEVTINGRIQGVWNGTTENCGKPGKPGCGAEIGFAMTQSGKWMPFDLDTYESHFSTCTVRKNFKDVEKRD